MTSTASKNRPLRFSGVIGQDGVCWTLKSLLAVYGAGYEFPTALLFTGPSGVGKTSLARILARALNCSGPEAGEPCLLCASCQQSLSTGHPAVIEIDAANYASAQEARDLVSSLQAANPFKSTVVILDECHAMSRQSWDVLLRTVESQPSGVVFIFCTTSPDRLREEVISRVMRFDLKAPSKPLLAGLIQSAAAAAGRSLGSEASYEIAHRSGGNVRLAYQLLDQVLLHPTADVESVLGEGRFGLRLLEAALRRDRMEGTRILDAAWDRYGNTAEIFSEWADAIETLFRFKFSDHSDDSQEILVRYRDICSGYHETMLAAGLEAIAEWASRGRSRSSLTFAWASFMKALGGPTVVDSAALGAARKHARKATAADLSNFTI